jgi:hypothetical protein
MEGWKSNKSRVPSFDEASETGGWGYLVEKEDRSCGNPKTGNAIANQSCPAPLVVVSAALGVPQIECAPRSFQVWDMQDEGIKV